MNNTNQANFPLSSLYVGDLCPDVTEAMLYEKFSQSGPVLSIRVCRDLVTRKSLGYAYVNFQQPGDAERALDSMNFDELKGIPMRIMWSQRDPSLRKSGVGNIFIKNLDKSIDNKALYDTFNQFGNILSCKIVKDEKATSKGYPRYGFVHFESEEAAVTAIEEVNGMMLADRKVFVGRFKNKTDRVREVGEKNRQFTNVFIKNLPEEYTEEELNDLVRSHGNTLSVKLMAGEDGSSKCFGFASFSNHEEADQCVEALNGKLVKEKELFAGRAQKKVERVNELRANYEKRKQDRQQKYAGVNLYVKNLDDTVNDETLRKEFAAHGTITSAKVMTENGSSKGFGFVCYSTTEEANKAATEMNGRIVGSKPLYVAMAQRKEDRKMHLQQQYLRGAGPTIRTQMAQPGFGQGYPYANANMGAMAYPYNMGQQMNSPGPGKFQNMPGHMAQARMPGARPQYNMARPNMMGMQRPNMMNMARPNGMFMQRPNMAPVMNMPMNNMNRPVQYPGHMNQMNQELPSGYKLNQGVRNNMQAYDPSMGMVPQQMPNMQMNQMQQQQPDMHANTGSGDQVHNEVPRNTLDPAELARIPAQDQKQLIGEKLYPLVQEFCDETEAGKVTGMILELENEELLALLENTSQIRDKVLEAKNVLDSHANNQPGQEIQAAH